MRRDKKTRSILLSGLDEKLITRIEPRLQLLALRFFVSVWIDLTNEERQFQALVKIANEKNVVVRFRSARTMVDCNDERLLETSARSQFALNAWGAMLSAPPR